jgi:Tfp pilus assembly protein PilN
MRPINLIPTEQRRRSSGAGARSGPLPFMLVGALALLLVGVLLLLHYSNQIQGREDNVAHLESEKAEATAQATKLAPFTAFAQVTEQRTSTIAELADARFDWARVIQQLSLVLPPDVYFTAMNGSAGGSGSEGAAIGSPSLSLAGCASSQNAVAGFVASLKQVDGITRVSLENSALNEGGEEDAVSGASPCASGGKAQFSILAVFDFAPPSPDGEVAPVEAEASEAEPEGEASSEGSEEPSSETEGAAEPGSSEGGSAPTQSASTGEGGATG